MVRFEHSGLTVRDLDSAIALFGCLGYRLVARRTPPDPNLPERVTGVKGAAFELAIVARADHAIELLAYSNPVAAASKGLQPNQQGFAHLCYRTNAFEKTKRDLAGFGLIPRGETMKITDGPAAGVRVVYLSDGFLTIELLSSEVV